MASEADMPPPLEDMTATLEQAKKLRDLRIGTQAPSTDVPRNIGKKTHPTSTSTSTQRVSSAAKTKSTAGAAESKAEAANAIPIPDAQPSTSKAALESVDSTKLTSSTAGAKAGSGDFGGLRKGFLFGGGPSKAPAKQQQQQPAKGASVRNGGVSGKANASTKAESMPFITSKPEEQKSGLQLDQVQEAMNSTKGLLNDRDWVTEDLLEKVQKNETLTKQLGDPRFMQAITEFQHNPKEAIKKYEGSPEITTFLKEFCGLLGAHFTALGSKQDRTNPGQDFLNPPQPSGPKITEVMDGDRPQDPPAAPPPVDPQVQQILADPANRELLMDPKIQQLIQHLRSSPEQAQRMLREGDREFKQKLDRLISLGLIKFQG